MLGAYRVLDLTDENGLLCGQILADLGADVIQVEPRAGSSARLLGPYLKDRTGLERKGRTGPDGSLFWAAYARNKRGLALDLEDPEDHAAFVMLVSGADFLIESAPPGEMARLGLGYEQLRTHQPGLVYVSISPFGQHGPKAGWAATDLTLVAAGGFSYLSGDADAPPLRVCVPQAHAQAGADAAVGALVAHAERRRTGIGQQVDVSAQQSVTLATMFRSLDEAVGSAPAQRIAGGLQAGGVLVPIRHRLRDGWVTLGPSILPSTGHFMKRLLEWVADEGQCDPSMATWEWGSFGLKLGAGRLPSDAYDPVARVLDRFFATRTKAEVMRAAVARRLLIAPVLGLDEIIESEHLEVRAFPTRVKEPHSCAGRYPGPFARFDTTPIRYRRGAPQIGEHATALLEEGPRQPAACRSEQAGPLPLEGVKILDLFWVLAGPTATRLLADYGATVVRVESTRRLDTLRVSPPFQFNTPHPEGGVGFQSANANKLGITLDLESEEGRGVIRDLVRWSDVATESFAPGVLKKLGLGWESLRKLKPDLIMISSCLMGQTGPWRDFTGFGRLAIAATGFQQLAQWPDRPPAGPFGAYTDAIASRYNAVAILAALDHRERTGEGQIIDLSQAEASLHFLAPAFLDWTLNGTVQAPVGNDDPLYHPHGVFRAKGDERWVAIAVRHDEDWRRLCEAMGRPDLEAHREPKERASAVLAEWVASRQAEDVEALLQAHRVPAHVVLDTPALFADPQLRHREHFLEIAHDMYPSTTVESSRLQLSRTPARHPERALSLGRDNREVLESLLGYSPERVAALAELGVLL